MISGKFKVHCRSQKKAEFAAKEISRVAGGRGQVHAYSADMASMRQVRDLAQRVHADHPSIDILLNNAGKLHALSLSRTLAFSVHICSESCFMGPTEISLYRYFSREEGHDRGWL